MAETHLDPKRILFEDNHCLAINKPVRLLSVGDETADPSLLELAKSYIKVKYNKPGDVYLGVVQRLDRPVSGVILFARTSKAAARLSDQFRQRSLSKIYLALVTGPVLEEAYVLEDHLLKDSGSNTSAVVRADVPDAKLCRLEAKVLARAGRMTLLQIIPETGRSHQIRVQLANQGWPIVGDGKYGSPLSGAGMIALHARQLKFQHPTLNTPIELFAPIPKAWDGWAGSLATSYAPFAERNDS